MSNKEDITALVERIKDGELDLTSELWNKVERLAAWQARRIVTKLLPSAGVDFDDLYNSGYIALCDAVEHYEPNSGEFLSLFMLCLRTAFAEASGGRSKREMKDPLRQASTSSLNELLPNSEKTTFVDVIPDERNAFEEADERIYRQQLHEALDKALNAIPERESDVIRRRYYQGETL